MHGGIVWQRLNFGRLEDEATLAELAAPMNLVANEAEAETCEFDFGKQEVEGLTSLQLQHRTMS